jgi:hypothetical protein
MQFHFKKILFLSLLFVFCFLLLPCSFIHAQTNTSNTTDVTKAPYTLLTPLPCNAGLGVACSTGSSTINSIDLSDFISYAYKFMIALAVVLAVFMITVGGFEYMLSGAMDTKNDAKKKIEDAVWGLLLALVAYLLLYTIDPNLVSSGNLSIPPITYSSALTQMNSTRTAVEAQLQQDQQNAAVLGQSNILTTQAQNSYNQADQLYNQNNCDQYDLGGGIMDSSAPAACNQAEQLYDQGDTAATQNITTLQKGFDQQVLTSVQGIFTSTPPPTVTPCSGGATAGVGQCYNGYMLDTQTQTTLQTQLNNIYNDRQTSLTEMSQISNGDQSSIITESQSTANQINTLMQNAIVQGKTRYEQTQQEENIGP